MWWALIGLSTDQFDQPSAPASSSSAACSSVSVVTGASIIAQTDDILVACQLLQEDNLSERPLRISRILECIKVLL